MPQPLAQHHNSIVQIEKLFNKLKHQHISQIFMDIEFAVYELDKAMKGCYHE